MDVKKLLAIQSDLNEYTLNSCNVYTVPNAPLMSGPLVVGVKASMSLAIRDGQFLRHHSPVVQMCDMYQWAGNRELLELIESDTVQNSRVEIVDIMHFDLSILALTCALPEEIVENIDQITLGPSLSYSQQGLTEARAWFDDLQLRKWWTTKTIDIAAIRVAALVEFGTLMAFATNDNQHLFAGLDDVEETYLKKVKVNYDRIKSGYNHVANKEQGNASI